MKSKYRIRSKFNPYPNDPQTIIDVLQRFTTLGQPQQVWLVHIFYIFRILLYVLGDGRLASWANNFGRRYVSRGETVSHKSTHIQLKKKQKKTHTQNNAFRNMFNWEYHFPVARVPFPVPTSFGNIASVQEYTHYLKAIS